MTSASLFSVDTATEGGRSENAEYIYRKKQLREIDARVWHLRKSLKGIKAVGRIPENRDKVFLDAWVHLVDDHDNENIYTILEVSYSRKEL